MIVAHQSLAKPKPKIETIVLCTLGKGEKINLHCFLCCKKHEFVMIWQDDREERYMCPTTNWLQSVLKDCF